jgi:hypothetical protein
MARVFAVAVGILLLATGCSSDSTTRDDAGEIVEGGEVGVFAIREGDCVNVPNGTEVTEFEGTSCDEPHDGQAYALFDVTGYDEFPGASVLTTEAETGCVSRFEGFIGIPYDDSVYYINNINPSPDSWDRGDDREIICLAVPQDGGPKLTVDLRGIAE